MSLKYLIASFEGISKVHVEWPVFVQYIVGILWTEVSLLKTFISLNKQVVFVNQAGYCNNYVPSFAG